MSEKFQDQYRIPSARAPWHNYNGGIYFVTICTAGHAHYFGEIVPVETVCTPSLQSTCTPSQTTINANPHSETVCTPSLQSTPQMQLSPIGQFASDQFINVKTHYPYADIPLFVVMPNHIHAVVVIDDRRDGVHTSTNNQCEPIFRDGVHTVSTGERWKSTFVDEKMQRISNRKGQLSVVIGGIKRAITLFARENSIPFAWQTRFHDHIIRDQDELNRIAQYIEDNVVLWYLGKM